MDGVAAPPWSSALEDLLDGTVARRRGHAAAIVDLGGAPTISHGELHRRAVRAADTMRNLGWVPGDVAVLTLPEPDLVVAVLACLRLGICCTVAEPGDEPCPPVEPTARLHRVDRLPTLTSDPAVIDLTDRRVPPPQAPAYLVATSGTSGPPKWIEVPRSALSALMAGLPGRYGLRPDDRVLRFFSRSGDTVFEELLVTLAAGATVVVGHRPGSFPGLDADITGAGVTVLQLPTSYWHPAVEHWLAHGGPPAAVRLVIAGSEAMRPDVVARWAQLSRRPALVNAYGPSEVTITALVHRVDPAADVHEVPIGTALPGVDAMVVDDGQVVDGEGTGELWLGGAQLASGYRAASPGEHSRFVTDGPVPGRWYRTGDLVRRRADGLLVHLGRLDRQVKIAGHRVEPEQVEHHLQAHPGVAAAVVRPVRFGDHLELTADVVLRAGAEVDDEALRRHLSAALPPAAIPTTVRFVADLERTATGKLDRTARTERPSASSAGSGFAAWWQAITGRAPGPADRLVDAGVASLRILQALADLEERWGRRLDLRTVVTSTFAELSALAPEPAQRSAPSSAPPSAVPPSGPAPVGANATQVWLAGQVLEGRAVPVVTAAIRLPVSRAAARAAIALVTDRHPALRARWCFDTAGVLQVVSTTVEPVVDEPGVGDARQVAATHARRLAADPEGPQVRWALLDDPGDRGGASGPGTTVVMVGHHALLDDGAVAVVAEDLADAAAGRRAADRTIGLADLALAVTPDPAAQRRWTERVAPSTAGDGWSADQWPTGSPTGIARRHPVTLTEDMATALAEALAAVGVSATTAAAGLAAVAGHHLTGMERQWLAVPLTQRHGRDRLRAVGYALATVPVPVEVLATEPWSHLLSRLHRQLWECSADALVDQTEVLAASGRGRLGPFAVAGRTEEPLDGAEWIDATIDATVAPTPMVVEVVLRGVGVTGPACDVTVLADEGLDHHDVEATVAAVSAACGRLATSSPDRAAVADAVPVVHGSVGPPWWASVDVAGVALGNLRAAAGNPFVSEAHRTWSGDDLVAAIVDLSAYLTEAGVGAGHMVVLDLPPGGELVAAVVACVRVGAVYVPVEPGAPENWRAEVAARTGAAWVVRPGLAVEPTGVVARPWRGTRPAAYVMFTSGSTGTPRGVVVALESITRLVLHQTYAEVTPGSVVGLASNPAFDASTFELWSALLNGARLAVPPPETRHDPLALGPWLRREEVSVLFVTTALFGLIAEISPDALASLDTVLVGGETMDPAWMDTLWTRGRPGRVVHVYGPTETTTFATWHEVTGLTADSSVPIGGPIETTLVSVRRHDGAGTSEGMVGELWIGGPGVGDPLDLGPDTRWTSDATGDWYRTGDLVRWVKGGAVFVGRADDQVKIRGYRIELSEVERALRAVAGVRRAAAAVQGQGPDARLVAAITADPGVRAADVAELLARTVRPHLVPSVLSVVDQLPLTPNGKLDRRAVVALVLRDEPSSATRSETELAAGVCQQVTGTPTEPATRLADLGLTSLQWVRLLHALEAATGTRLALAELMTCERVNDIERLVQHRTPSIVPPGVMVLRGGTGSPLWVVAGPSAAPTIWAEVIGHIPPGRPVWAPLVAHEGATPTVEELATQVLRVVATQPGPVEIIGYSLGAMVAVEVARRISRPCQLVLIDPIVHIRAERIRAPHRPEAGTLRRVARRLRARLHRTAGDPLLDRTALALADKRAQRRYRAQPHDGNCTVIRATDGLTRRQRRLQERALRTWLPAARWTDAPGHHRGDGSILTGAGALAIAQHLAQ